MATQAPIRPLDLENIQGDILGGFPKRSESYFLFEIIDAAQFRVDLATFVPLVKSTARVLKDRELIRDHKRITQRRVFLHKIGVNISFSAPGLVKLGIPTQDISNLGDKAFQRGQLKDAESLKDNGKQTPQGFDPDWEPAFKESIDGLIDIAGDSRQTVESKLDEIKRLFGLDVASSDDGPGPSIRAVTIVDGDVRPGDLSAHEHFGFLDGISNPAIIGFDVNPAPGPKPIRAGNIIIKQDGDSRRARRPDWATDGSFLVFRKLSQLVPEFDTFLDENPVVAPGLSHEAGSALRGARIFGRWKSGAPLELTPLEDNPALVKDANKVNNFRFEGQVNDQSRCPFAAHIRKTNPRADLEDQGFPIDKNRIMRRGIQFGEEVTDEERARKQTIHERGLLFACYQSSIDDGFHFMQTSWANDPTFPFTQQTGAVPGLDPIIGQAGSGGPRQMSGSDPNNLTEDITINAEFVVPRGGGYFFVPSIKVLRDVFAQTA